MYIYFFLTEKFLSFEKKGVVKCIFFLFAGKFRFFFKLSYVCIYFFLPEKLDFLKNKRVILRFWYMLEALVFF